MKTTLRVHILVAIAAFISSHAIAQTSTLGGVLSTPTIFQKIKVTEEAFFQRKVTFDNGLLLDGDARFQNDIVGDGALNIAKSVRFSGLPENPTINYIITGDVSGDLGRAPLTVLARELESTLKNLNELTVKDATTLKGQLTLGDGLQINGAANFANDVLVHGNLAVTGGVKLNLPPALDEVPMGNTVLTYDPSSNSIVPVTGKVLGTPFGPELACPETQLPATWERGVNKLVTDRCSKDIKVGIGTQTPSEAIDIIGNAKVSNSVLATQFVAQTTITGSHPLIVKINGEEKFMVAANGKTYAEEINVVLSKKFPDYVFKKSYPLMSIEALSKYIQKNGHLPGMPTAEEVEKNGIDLGEMVRLLVEKNEVMSLYIIQLENKTKDLDAKIKQLEEKVK